MEMVQACAREHGIAVSLGFSENSNNSLYIANALIGPDGEIKVHRRKMKPTHMERTVFGDASGHCLQSVAELPFGRVGSLACWEHIQPLLKYNTIAQNEEIHVAIWPPLNSEVGDPIPWSMTAEGIHSLSFPSPSGFANRFKVVKLSPAPMQLNPEHLCCTALQSLQKTESSPWEQLEGRSCRAQAEVIRPSLVQMVDA